MTTTHAAPIRRPAGRRGFSVAEMLVALMISASLLTAMLAALDASWRGYKVTTESASTHVVARIVAHRLSALIRTGQEFGPYPADFFDPLQNPVVSSSIEFVSEADRLAGNNIVTRIERRTAESEGEGVEAGGEGEEPPERYELWYVRLDEDGSIIDEHPLLTDLVEATFILEFEPGPRLVRATIDLMIEPNDYRDISVGVPTTVPVIRLVTTAAPRQNE